MPTNPSSLARVIGIELSYQVTGEGEPLILLHGGFGSVEMGPQRGAPPCWATGHRGRPSVAWALAGR